MLQQTQSRPNHTSYRKFHFNEFVANVFQDNIGPKNNQPPSSKKKWGRFLVLNVKKLPEGVGIFGFLFILKLFLYFQRKYHFQSDFSYDLKQKKCAQRPPSYTRGRHAAVALHLQF